MSGKMNYISDIERFFCLTGTWPNGDEILDEYDYLLNRAEKIIDRHTHNRIRSMASIPEAVEHLAAELIVIEFRIDKLSKGRLKSFSNDGYSESYEMSSADNLSDQEEKLILDYLSDETDDEGTPLLYLGV